MHRIVVLAGGTSDEREISLHSGAAVAKALEKSGYGVTILDPADGLGGQLAAFQRADAVFPVLHGAGGEDGTVQKFLEDHGVRYVGPDSQASALCFDKNHYTQLLANHGILVPETELVNLEQYEQSALTKKPFVLKPNDGGSSIDTFIVRNPAVADKKAIREAFGQHQKLLLQELVTGMEITIPVLGEKPLPVIEIIPPQDGEFDYENKYNGKTQELCPPKHVSQEAQAEAQALAMRIHQLTACRDMSRTDIIVDGEKLYVLETNTIPGLTDESLLPVAASVAGYNMPRLCRTLVEMALTRNS